MKEIYQAIEGQDISDEASDLILDVMFSEKTRNAEHSLRKYFKQVKRELKIIISLSTVVNVIHQHTKVSELSRPMIQRLIDIALEIKEQQQTEAA